MATLTTPDGRRLRKNRPQGAQYLGGGGGYYPPLWSDGTTNEPDGYHIASYTEIYETQPIVAAVVNKLFQQIATLPLKVFKKAEDNSRERVSDHPLAKLFDQPSPRSSTVDLLQSIAIPLLIHGNALIYKYRAGKGEPVSMLLPLDWAQVSAYAQQGGPVEWWGTTQFGEERFVKAEEVIHFAWRSVGSEIGVSPLKQLAVTLKIEDAAQRHTVSAFKNGVNPSIAVILHPDQKWDDEARKLARDSVENTHAGPDKQGRMMVVGAGSDVKTLSHTAREAELIAVRKATAVEVCAVYDTKPTIIGILDNATYSNITETNLDLYKTTLRPRLRMIESTLMAQLVRDEPVFNDVFPEFDTSEVLKGNPVERFNSYKVQVESGVRSPAEIREIENLSTKDLPEEAFKLYLSKNNLRAIDEDPEPTPQSPPGANRAEENDGNARTDPDDPDNPRGTTGA